MAYRDLTKTVQIGNRVIGGGNPILIQSMCNTKTEDAASTIAQILELERAGCDIIRVAVPTMEAAESLKTIKRSIHIPLVADIHFDYRLAIAAIECGADKIRINPGNIGSEERCRQWWTRRRSMEFPSASESTAVPETSDREVRRRDGRGNCGERPGLGFP